MIKWLAKNKFAHINFGLVKLIFLSRLHITKKIVLAPVKLQTHNNCLLVFREMKHNFNNLHKIGYKKNDYP